jgi:protein gp37
VIFVNSMSDLFHEAVPSEYINSVFKVMRTAEQHVFQVLTKRHERLVELAGQLDWPPNVWMGVSVENQRFAKRIDYLRDVPAQVRFVSAEPLLGSLGALDLRGIHWLIAGGSQGRSTGRLTAIGCASSATNARCRKCRFSLSSGAADARSPAVGR